MLYGQGDKMSNNLRDKIDIVRFDPSAIQSAILDTLETALEGKIDVVDATNPFIFLMEASATTAATSMQYSQSIARELYPSIATSQEELYRHMADEDYIGRFALPGRATGSFIFSVDEVKALAVNDVNGGVRKIVIPRNTSITVGGNTFGIHYPIEMRVLPNDSLQIVYDASVVNELETLATNVVDFEIVTLDGLDYIKIDTPIYQFVLQDQYFPINASTGLTQTFTFKQSFYHARVFTGSPAAGWRQIKTTHSDQVFDPTEATALLQVVGQRLKVNIPQVYVSGGKLGTQIRVDIYSTKGNQEVILSNFPMEQYAISFNNITSNGTDTFTAPLASISSMGIFSNDTTRGGRDGIGLSELKQRVIFNANRKETPITDIQLETLLSDKGYGIVKRIDNITDRVYQAIRLLPLPSVDSISSPIGTLTALTEVDMNEVASRQYAYDNGLRVTLSPESIYTFENGLLKLLPEVEQVALGALSSQRLIQTLNERTYLYTPFHYVLDASDNIFDLRPYYLDAPSVISRRFNRDNTQIAAQASTFGTSFERVEQGYRLLVTVETSGFDDVFDINQLGLQLGFLPEGDDRYTLLNATFAGYVDDKAMFEFIIETNYDVDAKHRLGVTNFRQYPDDIQVYYTDLDTSFRLLFFVIDDDNLNLPTSEIDDVINNGLVVGNTVGIMDESITLRLGYEMSLLRSESRSVISSSRYQTYEEDVVWVYDKDVPKLDEDGAQSFTVDGNGDVIFEYLHRKGDAVLNEENEVQYKHLYGEVILDNDGNPMVRDPRTLNRQLTLVCFDARFFYATDPEVVSYRNTIPLSVVDYLDEDIANISSLLLERTRIDFSPKQTVGTIAVTISNGEVVEIPSAQSFVVTYYLTTSGFEDIALRTAITRSTRSVIAQQLTLDTVSVQNIENALKDDAGGEVISVDLDGLGEDNLLSTYTVVDKSSVSSVATRLELLSDGTVSVIDDITVNFIKHQ